MHCIACDGLLNEAEDARKSRATGERIQLCEKCFGEIADEVEVTENPELEDMGIEPEGFPEENWLDIHDEI